MKSIGKLHGRLVGYAPLLGILLMSYALSRQQTWLPVAMVIFSACLALDAYLSVAPRQRFYLLVLSGITIAVVVLGYLVPRIVF